MRAAQVVREDGADFVVVTESDDAVRRVREIAPNGVNRVIEAAFDANVRLDVGIVAQGGVVAAYSSGTSEPILPFWPLVFNNVVLQFLGSDDFPAAAKARAASDLTDALRGGALRFRIAAHVTLGQIAAAHRLVEHPTRKGRVVVKIR